MSARIKAVAAVAFAALLVPVGAFAQSAGSTGMGSLQAGYGGSRYTTARPQTGSTRDENGNRLIVNGIIQSGASAYSSASGGVSSGWAGAGGTGGTTIGGSTVIGNSSQVNNGNVTAGADLNGTLRLP